MMRTFSAASTAAAALLAATVALAQAPESPTPQTAASPVPPATTTAEAAYPGEASPTDVDAQREAIWNSPEMLEARTWIYEYARRSRRFTPQRAEQYLTQLSQSSPQEMQTWLERYRAHRANLARSAEVEQQARQIATQWALEQQAATRRSYESFNAWRSEGALLANERIHDQARFGGLMAESRRAFREAQLAEIRGQDYQWIVNPPWWVKERWAAATLPGDVPPWDPRNFMRDLPAPGDVGGGPNAGPSGEGGGPNAGPAGSGSASGPNAGPGVGGNGPNAGPGPAAGAGGSP